MKIAIIGAMDKEVELVSKNLLNKKTISKSGYVFQIGNIYNHEIILTISSIGKVATGLLMGTMLSSFEGIEKIINIGVAGGVMGKLEPGDVVLGEKYCYSDADARGFNYEYGQIPGCPKFFYGDKTMICKSVTDAHVGSILTADIFQTDKLAVDKIINEYFKDDNVLCLDMESTAFAQCAYKNNVDFLAIRAISDVIGSNDQTNKYKNALEMACTKAYNIMMEILKNI